MLTKKELSGSLISNPKNIFYFTDYYPHADAFLYITSDFSRLFVPALEFEDAKLRATDSEAILIDGQQKMISFVAGEILKEKPRNIGMEDLDMTVRQFQAFDKELKGIKLEFISEAIQELRSIKDPDEIKLLQRAGEISDRAMKAGIEFLQAGMTESEVAAEIEYAMKKHGSSKIAFDTIVASGPNAALPHATCSDKKIKENEYILLDIGAVYQNYHSDMTRTVILGQPSPRQQKIYDLVYKAKSTTVGEFQDLKGPQAMDASARSMIKEAGYDFIHALGHGVGLDIHEKPSISSISEESTFKDGFVFTIEPGIYIPKEGGVRLEDTYFIENQALKPLTKHPFQFRI